jgi:hypothetical protein
LDERNASVVSRDALEESREAPLETPANASLPASSLGHNKIEKCSQGTLQNEPATIDLDATANRATATKT